MAVVLGSCGAFEYSPNEVRLDESKKDLTRKNLERLLAIPAVEPLRFALVGDTQRGLDETDAFVDAVNRRGDIAFVAHGGDITDFGIAREYHWTAEIFGRLRVPYFTVAGNHDLYANGEDLYEAMFGPLDYAFVYGRTKFVFINTNSREFVFDGTVPNLAWLAAELQRTPEFDRAVVVGHVPPLDQDFDPALAQPYVDILNASGTAVLSLHGHLATYRTELPFASAIPIVVGAEVRRREYLVITLSGMQVSVESVEF